MAYSADLYLCGQECGEGRGLNNPYPIVVVEEGYVHVIDQP